MFDNTRENKRFRYVVGHLIAPAYPELPPTLACINCASELRTLRNKWFDLPAQVAAVNKQDEVILNGDVMREQTCQRCLRKLEDVARPPERNDCAGYWRGPRLEDVS